MASRASRLIAACAAAAACQAGAQAVCRITSSAPLGFGLYDVFASTARISQSDILVTCDRNGGPANIPVTIGLGAGDYGTNTANRQMRAAGRPTPLLYGLYRDSGRSLLWGNASGSDTNTQTLNVPNKGSATATFRVYGQIPPQQDVYPGTYGDRVQATLTP
jgi:spore coat protein U-like protein